MTGAYYNENDPFAAEWLRNLIKAGAIAPGVVDERDIRDVRPADLAGFVQCHFFAGIGGWSRALRLAGWDDERPIWTGSCPCQPFSAAGARKGFADERHLWPAWYWLIRQRRPSHIFGEQVAGTDGLEWLDLVCTDLEAGQYAIGPVIIPSAGVGAPHGRHRIYFVAYSPGDRATGSAGDEKGTGSAHGFEFSGSSENDPMANAESRRFRIDGSAPGETGHTDQRGTVGAVVHTAGEQMGIPGFTRERGKPGDFWDNAEWIACIDGKARPTQPGLFPLASGLPFSMGHLLPEVCRLAEMAGLSGKSLTAAKRNRVAGLRAYGNAITPQAAEQVIRAFMEWEERAIAKAEGQG